MPRKSSMTPEPGATCTLVNPQTHVECGQPAVARLPLVRSGTEDEVAGELLLCAKHRGMIAMVQFFGPSGEDIVN
jgi:hypothetical protein